MAPHIDLHTLKPTVTGRAGVMKPPWSLHMDKNACAEQTKQMADSCFGLVDTHQHIHCMSSVRRKLQALTKSAHVHVLSNLSIVEAV